MLQPLDFVRHEWRKKCAEWKFSACREIRLSSNSSGRAWRRDVATCSVRCASGSGDTRSQPPRSRKRLGEKDCINSRIDSIGIPVELLEGHTVTGTCCFDMCTHDRSASSRVSFFVQHRPKKLEGAKKPFPSLLDLTFNNQNSV